MIAEQYAYFPALPGLLSVFPLRSGQHSISRRRLVAPGLFLDFDLARDPGYRDRSAGHHHAEPRRSRPLRPVSRNRALDLAALDTRLRHLRNRLFHALPMVTAQLAHHGGTETRRRNC